MRPDDPAQIQYTGGTTGFPKGVLLHHRGIANTPNFVLTQAGMRTGDTWINVMPLFHVGGCVTTGLGIVGRRGTHVVVPEFQPALILELIEALGGNMSLLVPTMLRAGPRASGHDHARPLQRAHDRLRRGTRPGRADPPNQTSVQLRVHEYLRPDRGARASSPRRACEDTPEDQAETIGRAVPHVELKIADPATAEILPIGAEGEICARGHQMMIGYLDDPQATAATLREDGWLHTGDLGSMDERGYLRITGRLKDTIIRGGENISPREVEEVLYTHPGVAEAIVLGVPDAEWGEEVAAVIRPVDPSSPPSAVRSCGSIAARRSRGSRHPLCGRSSRPTPPRPRARSRSSPCSTTIAAGRLVLRALSSPEPPREPMASSRHVRAVRHHRGEPRVRLEEVPVPQAGDGEVLVEVTAAGLCGTDVSLVFGGHGQSRHGAGGDARPRDRRPRRGGRRVAAEVGEWSVGDARGGLPDRHVRPLLGLRRAARVRSASASG